MGTQPTRRGRRLAEADCEVELFSGREPNEFSPHVFRESITPDGCYRMTPTLSRAHSGRGAWTKGMRAMTELNQQPGLDAVNGGWLATCRLARMGAIVETSDGPREVVDVFHTGVATATLFLAGGLCSTGPGTCLENRRNR